MKRSDMLTILEEAIIDNYDYCHDSGVMYSFDEILKTLEEAGMLPPYNENHGVDSFTIAMGCGTHRLHNWEPEDVS